MKIRTKRKNQKTRRLELENEKYREIIEQLQSKIKYDDYLKEENKKLIEWIQKILQEFGTSQVNDRKISIPIYKNSINSFIDNEPLIEEFEKDNYTMNITLFGFKKMTLEEIEKEVYRIWYGLNCEYYSEVE